MVARRVEIGPVGLKISIRGMKLFPPRLFFERFDYDGCVIRESYSTPYL
jgi:hypothetical protein